MHEIGRKRSDLLDPITQAHQDVIDINSAQRHQQHYFKLTPYHFTNKQFIDYINCIRQYGYIVFYYLERSGHPSLDYKKVYLNEPIVDYVYFPFSRKLVVDFYIDLQRATGFTDELLHSNISKLQHELPPSTDLMNVSRSQLSENNRCSIQ